MSDANTPIEPMEIEMSYFPLLDLPQELCMLTIAMIDNLKDWSSLSQTCRLVYVLCNSNFVWRSLTKNVFGDMFIANAGEESLDEYALDKAVSRGSGCWKSYCYESLLLKQEPFKWQKVGASPFQLYSNNINLPRSRLGHTGCSVNNHTVVYIGGYNDESPPRFNDIYFFDMNTKKFDLPPINGTPYRIARHASVFINDTIYSFGGYDGEGTFYGMSSFHVPSKTFEYPIITNGGSEPGKRTNHAACAVNNRMYIYGGNKDENGVYLIYDDMQMFDGDTMTWTNLTSRMKGELPGKVIGHKLVSIGTMIYLIGGGIWFPKQDSWSSKFNHIYSFDTETLEWKKLAVKGDTLGVCTFTMVWTYKSYIFVFGGQEMVSEIVSKSLWVYDTISQTGKTISFKESRTILARDMGTTNIVEGGVISFAGSSGSAVNCLDILTHKLFDMENIPCQCSCSAYC